MARPADDLPERLLIDDENRGLSDDGVAAAFADWLADLDEREPLHLEVTAAETLAEACAAGELASH